MIVTINARVTPSKSAHKHRASSGTTPRAGSTDRSGPPPSSRRPSISPKSFAVARRERTSVSGGATEANSCVGTRMVYVVPHQLIGEPAIDRGALGNNVEIAAPRSRASAKARPSSDAKAPRPPILQATVTPAITDFGLRPRRTKNGIPGQASLATSRSRSKAPQKFRRAGPASQPRWRSTSACERLEPQLPRSLRVGGDQRRTSSLDGASRRLLRVSPASFDRVAAVEAHCRPCRRTGIGVWP